MFKGILQYKAILKAYLSKSWGIFFASSKAKHLNFLPLEMKGEKIFFIQQFRALRIKLLY